MTTTKPRKRAPRKPPPRPSLILLPFELSAVLARTASTVLAATGMAAAGMLTRAIEVFFQG